MTDSPAPSASDRFTQLVMSVARLVNDQHDASLPRGDIAALRREDGATSPTFYKLAALVLDESTLPRAAALRDEAERRWARVVHLLAVTGGQHALGGQGVPTTGAALAKVELAEPRFLRFVRAEGDALDAAARAAIAPLRQRALTFDPRDLAALVLSAPHPSGRLHHEAADTVRRRLARDFYRTAARTDATDPS
jgi:hypothetical protein